MITIRKIQCLGFALLLGLALPVTAQTTTWTGGGSDALWTTLANWDNGVPDAGHTAVIGTGEVLLSAPTAALTALNMTGGTLTFSNWNARVTATAIAITGGTVTHVQNSATAAPWTPDARVYFECDTFLLDENAVINVDFMGYAGVGLAGDGYGPGAGARHSVHPEYTAGGSHGGYGGSGIGISGGFPPNPLPYGNAQAPEWPGSSGGAYSSSDGASPEGIRSGAGGGVVRIDAQEGVTIHGLISANGRANHAWHSSSGAGGSIYITCRTLSGANGILRAMGGSGDAGSYAQNGGGGRVAVVYDPAFQTAGMISTMQFLTTPGTATGINRGIADIGTLYFPDDTLLAAHVGAGMVGQLIGISDWTVASLSLTASWIRFFEEGAEVTISNDLTIDGANSRLEIGGTIIAHLGYVEFFGATNTLALTVGGDLTLSNGGGLTVYAGATNGTTVTDGAIVQVAGDTHLMSGTRIRAKSDPVTGGSVVFDLHNLTVDETAVFSADAGGYAGRMSGNGNGLGPGRGFGASTYGHGGGYGGAGGGFAHGFGGADYGDALWPDAPGSGGGARSGNLGGYGGGLIHILASGTVRVDGTLRADGGHAKPDSSTRAGGGSGGGIFIHCRAFEGAATGLLSARGGDSADTSSTFRTSGGGGGRIAVYFGQPYEDDLPAGRFVISEDAPGSFLGGNANVVVGGGETGHVNQPHGLSGTIRFVEILTPPGTILILR